MVKKSRGRHLMSQLMSNSRRRWFELRCDESDGHPSYGLLYYKAKGDPNPKGMVRLSAFDCILQSESDLSEITLKLERDKETNHQMLVMQADDADCAEVWIEAFQHAVLAMNRLTMILEDDEEDRNTAAGNFKSMKSMLIAGEVDVSGEVNWGKKGGGAGSGGGKEATGTEVGGKGGGGNGAVPFSDSAADEDNRAKPEKSESKRQMVKNFLAKKTKPKEEDGSAVVFPDWPKISGNSGNSTSGKALMYCMMHEWKKPDEDDDDSSVSTASTAPIAKQHSSFATAASAEARFPAVPEEAATEEADESPRVESTKSRDATTPSLPPPPPPPPAVFSSQEQEDVSSLREDE
jgi:hypothetical protein